MLGMEGWMEGERNHRAEMCVGDDDSLMEVFE